MSRIPVIIDVKEKGAKKADRNIKSLSGSLGGLAKSAALAGGAFLGAGALVSGLKAATAAAAEQELAEKKLRFAAGGLTNELIKQAQALQKNTIFGDEAIISQQAYLASLGLTGDQIKDTISASLDLAAATGMSLESAVMNTSKTLSGMAGELGEKLGPAFRELTPEALKAGEGIKFIAEQFGGTAQAEAKTFAGTITQTKNAIGDLAEVIGIAMTPALGRMATRIKIAAEFWGDFLDIGKDNKEESEKLTGELGKLNEQINTQKDRIGLLKEAYMDGQITFHEFRDTTRMIDERIDSLNDKFQKLQVTMMVTKLGFKKESFDGYLAALKKVEVGTESIDELNARVAENKEKQTKLDIKNAALSGKSASDMMKQVVRSETMEAVAGYLSSVLKSVPFPLNLIAAAGGGALVSGLMEKQLSKIPQFATGGDFVTSGPQMIMVGDNPSGRERVQVTPLGGDPNINGPQGSSVTVNVSGNVMTQDFVEGDLADAFREATRRGVAFS